MILIQVGAPLREEQPPSGERAYSDWKGWGHASDFGQIAKGDIAYFNKELRDVVRIAPPIKNVLEIGFGSGAFLGYCRSRGWDVKGTELLPEQVSAGNAAGFEVYQADHLVDFTDETFDLIVAFDVLEHIPGNDSVEFLSTLASKLRPNGALLLRYPNADTWLGNPLQHGDPTHVSAIGYYKLEYLAHRAGLEIARYRPQTRRGFATSFVHGIHTLTAGTIITLSAALQKVLHFPRTPLVLSSSNVVCVLTRPDHGRPSAR